MELYRWSTTGRDAGHGAGTRRTLPAMQRPRDAWIIAAIALVVLAHVMGSPRNVGPDEASHQVASAALVRGERTGTPVPGPTPGVTFVVPGMVGEPGPLCYAFDVGMPVTCSVGPLTTTPHKAITTSQHYPPYGLVLPGLASFVPWAGGYAYLARLLNASIAVALFAAAVLMALRQKGQLVAIALLAGATPIAWFTMGITNPSAISTAAGAGLMVTLLCAEDNRPLPWLGVWSWAALMMVRRDGPFWVMLVVLVAAAAAARPPSWWWQRSNTAQRTVIVISWALAVVSVRTDSNSVFALLMAATPLLLTVIHLVVRWATHIPLRVVPVVVLLGGVIGTGIFLAFAPRSLDPGYVMKVIQATGDHLYQLVGRLGYLDASAPMSSVILWWATVGALAGAALLFAPRHARAGALMLGLVIVSAWVLEIGSGNRTGSYWQGRYSLPATIGLPMLLALGAAPFVSRLRNGAEQRITLVVATAAWWVWNATFFAAQRRWAVGAGGSVLPWEWDTWSAPVPPIIVLFAHGAATAALLWMVATREGHTDAERSAAPDEVPA